MMERWRDGEVEIGAASLSSFSSFARGPFDETRLNAASMPPQRFSASPLLRLLSAISSDPRD
jgi:hypothetical protein